ncbi:MAG: hypothetical protein QME51_02820 [Planctomycetota bacterium]|nr:hypothetical protein [Planctomycetota bacterium]MDI6787287.1 hypothetical protein [Planctomycetota bacterium]
MNKTIFIIPLLLNLSVTILLAHLSAPMSIGAQAEGIDEPHDKPKVKVETSSLSLLYSQIHQVDKEIEKIQQEIETIKAQITQALKDNKLELAKELTVKTTQLEKTLKDNRVELDMLINKYQNDFNSRLLWRKLMIEIGPQFTFFDNNIRITDVTGLRLRIHYRKDTFGRYHTYPFISISDSPLRDIVSSPIILEYRYSSHQTGNQNQEARVSTYLGGFGISGQIFNNTFISLSFMGGLQDYSQTLQDDIGPIFSYSMGLQQYFSQTFGIGLSATEDWVLTNATQIDNKTRSFFNFSITFFSRIRF